MMSYNSHSNLHLDIHINADKYELLQKALEKVKEDDFKIRAIDWMFKRKHNKSGIDTTTNQGEVL